MVAVLVCWAVVEVVLRQDLAPRALLLLAVLAGVGPLLWRRTHPLAAVVVSFGTLTLVDLARVLTRSQGALLNSTLAALILAYALFRWGSGREAARGLGVILVWVAITTRVADPTGPAEAVAGFALFLLAAALGAAIRFSTTIHIRDIDHAIVGVLRASQDTEFAPQPGVAKVEQLATDGQTRPCVEVTLSGEFDYLSPAVGSAIYRLAQESITHARRHARHATQVIVAVTVDADRVRLTVDNDGLSGAGGQA